MNQTKPKHIAVCGSDGDDVNLSKKGYHIAYQIGELIAQKGGIVVCGGGTGIMEGVCKGAKKHGGTTIGIMPGSDSSMANKYVDKAIPTNLGNRRNFLVVTSSDCIIAIGGRWGTLNEISFGFIIGKPVILIKNSGGVVDMLVESSFLKNYSGCYSIVETAQNAVDQAFQFIPNNTDI